LDQSGVTLFVGSRLSGRCVRREDGVAFGGHGKAQIALVNFHDRLACLDLLADIDEPRDDFSGDAKAEIALHPGRDDPCEAAFGVGGARGRRHPDKRCFLSRVAYGPSIVSGKRKRDQCSSAQHRQHGAP
jgi:hypothetical protein